MPQALVLEKARNLSLREIEVPLDVGPYDVKIKTQTIGICGSDVHYYQHGRIGPFVVDAPMVLGHEAAGIVVEIGSKVENLKMGARVCIEPGIPDWSSKESRNGQYNLDPSLTFWATPPIDGCLTPHVVHPANLCYELPDTLSAGEGAMVEPLAVCLQAVQKAQVSPGDIAVVLGAGPIGLLQALTALASGCAEVFIFDPLEEKLNIAEQFQGVSPLYARNGNPLDQVNAATNGVGADILFECSGASAAFHSSPSFIRPGGKLVAIGMPIASVEIDIVALQVKEITLYTVFRYANVYDRAVNLLASGKINVKPLITSTFNFADSIAAFERAAQSNPEDVKIQIQMPD